MAFLTTSDLTISPQDLAKLNAINPDIVDNSLKFADNYLSDRLIHMFDMEYELALVGNARNFTLVNIGVKIAQWEMYKNAPQINTPQIRQYDYEEALQWLDKAEQGGLLTNLKAQEDENKSIGQIRYGTSDNNNIAY